MPDIISLQMQMQMQMLHDDGYQNDDYQNDTTLVPPP